MTDICPFFVGRRVLMSTTSLSNAALFPQHWWESLLSSLREDDA